MLSEQVNNKAKRNQSEDYSQHAPGAFEFSNSPRKSYDEKTWLDEIIQKKRETTEIKLKHKILEQQQMKIHWSKQEAEENRKKQEKVRVKRQVAMEQLMQAKAIKQSNQILKEIERGHHKSLIEENIWKLDETEAKKIAIVSSRINFVHGEERL